MNSLRSSPKHFYEEHRSLFPHESAPKVGKVCTTFSYCTCYGNDDYFNSKHNSYPKGSRGLVSQYNMYARITTARVGNGTYIANDCKHETIDIVQSPSLMVLALQLGRHFKLITHL